MTGLIAALPMYDWPERHAEVDAQWAAIRDYLHAHGLDAPQDLTRRTGDLLDFWKRPDLLFSQTCWGPMEQGLDAFVQVVGQPSYDGIEGGAGELYSSAIIMRRADVSQRDVFAPSGKEAVLPIDLLRERRFAYNVPDSMSGIIGLTRDLEAWGTSIGLFSEQIETGGHRGSIRAVADGRADVAAIDCMSWHLAQDYEPSAKEFAVVGWTAKRKGLPYVTANETPREVLVVLRDALRSVGLV